MREFLSIPSTESKEKYLVSELNSPVRVLPSPTGITFTELDWCIYNELFSSQHAALLTLNEFVELIENLTNIPVEDEIAEKVKSSLNYLKKSITEGESGSIVASLLHSKLASDLAKKVFFDSNMMAMLYFPEEHKFALYLPLFLPLTFPIISGLKKEISRLIANRRKKASPTSEKPRFLYLEKKRHQE
eukprot:TRINITY_DN1967_c0_g1_i2.p2 TRINITY_DN1967_c0_g1~~TRINITY_DN1967_c0_g1_i2.p2  ORF type:complete len:188 (-),score=34.90 TRINITY_DN1967_c0_g1_i2:151-714(-)